MNGERYRERNRYFKIKCSSHSNGSSTETNDSGTLGASFFVIETYGYTQTHPPSTPFSLRKWRRNVSWPYNCNRWDLIPWCLTGISVSKQYLEGNNVTKSKKSSSPANKCETNDDFRLRDKLGIIVVTNRIPIGGSVTGEYYGTFLVKNSEIRKKRPGMLPLRGVSIFCTITRGRVSEHQSCRSFGEIWTETPRTPTVFVRFKSPGLWFISKTEGTTQRYPFSRLKYTKRWSEPKDPWAQQWWRPMRHSRRSRNDGNRV